MIQSDWGRQYVKRVVWPFGTDLGKSFDYYLRKVAYPHYYASGPISTNPLLLLP
jgi:hypothetical protein